MQPINSAIINSTNTTVETTSFISSVKNVSLHFAQSLVPDINRHSIKVNFNPLQFGLSSVQLLTGGGKTIFSTAVKLYGAASALGLINSATALETTQETRSETRKSTTPKAPISIRNCKELSEIGSGIATPDNGVYILVNDINCLNKNTIITPPFKGTLLGNDYKISKLREPIFEKITGGSVKNLEIVDSKIRGTSALSNIIHNSKIMDISFNNIRLKPKYLGGLLTKSLQGNSSCSNIRVSNSNITEWGAVSDPDRKNIIPTIGGTGIIIGEMKGQCSLKDAFVINSSIETRGNVHTGGAVGTAKNQAQLTFLFVNNATVHSRGHAKTAGGVVGLLEASASFINAHNTQVISSGESCRTGGLIGKTASISQTLNSNVVAVLAESYEINFPYAGTLVGQNDGRLNHLSSVNSTSIRSGIITNKLIATNTNQKSTTDVLKREDCKAGSFEYSPFEGNCSIIPEEVIPEFAVSPSFTGVFLSGMLTGALSLAASTGIAYLTYKYATSKEKLKSIKERANLLFKPVMTNIPLSQKSTYAVAETNKQKGKIKID